MDLVDQLPSRVPPHLREEQMKTYDTMIAAAKDMEDLLKVAKLTASYATKKQVQGDSLDELIAHSEATLSALKVHAKDIAPSAAFRAWHKGEREAAAHYNPKESKPK